MTCVYSLLMIRSVGHPTHNWRQIIHVMSACLIVTMATWMTLTLAYKMGISWWILCNVQMWWRRRKQDYKGCDVIIRLYLTCRGITYIGNMLAQCSLSNTDFIKTKSLDFQIFLFVGLFFGLVTNFMAADSDADVGHTLFYKYALIQKINW